MSHGTGSTLHSKGPKRLAEPVEGTDVPGEGQFPSRALELFHRPADFTTHKIARSGVGRRDAVIRGHVDICIPCLYLRDESGKRQDVRRRKEVGGRDRASGKDAVSPTTIRRNLAERHHKRATDVSRVQEKVNV